MKKNTYQAMVKVVVAMMLIAGSAVAAGSLGTFVQLNRGIADKTVEQWRHDFEQMTNAGITRVVVQWAADDKVSYFTNSLPFAEQYPVIERLFAGMEGIPLSVYLGLRHDPNYWTEITGREVTLRDYFLVRLAHNLGLQKALMDAFSGQKAWKGYYLPDEIDDKSWRGDGRGKFMRDYLVSMAGALKKADPGRTVAVSAFFRGRTSPDVYARTLRGLVAETGLDDVMIQDGCGESDPPFRYLPDYFKAIREHWKMEAPSVECVVEAFRRVATTNGAFAAEPVNADLLKAQLKLARENFDRVTVFSFLDYTDPDLGASGAAAYQALLAP